MPVSIGNITLYMGPHTLGAPDDLEAAIVGFIGAAKNTLDIAVQELESRPIAEAVVEARRRGVKVRIVLEGDYLVADTFKADPFSPGGKHEPNRDLHAALLRASCEVRTDYNANIFHQKFIVRDRAGGRRALLTGSTNFTPTGTHANLNHLVEVKSARVLEQYGLEFDEIWDGTFGKNRQRHDPKPGLFTVSKVKVKPLFAPDHSPEMEIMKQMLKARKRIDFAIFTFSKSSGIDDVMAALIRTGMPVRGIFDHGQAKDWSPLKDLKAMGGDLWTAPKKAGLNKLHHKLMVLDEQVMVVGSFNYTDPANRLNDENIIVIGDFEEQNPDAVKEQKKLAKYALKEIDRMIEVHGQQA
ncbi:phospholipase D-like domain-containing protein [Magnetovibrio sp.]|uniref:phospholipase D-like domain-containing protein n=1 Tax=Magnetovibrio sp. TaxID=2024836 RepID=UPI002F950024